MVWCNAKSPRNMEDNTGNKIATMEKTIPRYDAKMRTHVAAGRQGKSQSQYICSSYL